MPVIYNIQILRAVAALLVVFVHLQPMLNSNFGTDWHNEAGVFGVDIFFVISGFIIFKITEDRFSFRSFVTNRFFRIVPLYWLATALLGIIFLLGFNPNGLHELDASRFALSLVFIPQAFSDGRIDLVLSLGWTLMYELFFYAAISVFILLFGRNGVLFYMSLFFVALVASRALFPSNIHLLEYYRSGIIIEFLYGGLIYNFLYKMDLKNGAAWIPLGFFLLALGFVIIFGEDVAGVPMVEIGNARFLLLGIPALLVVSGAIILEKFDRKWTGNTAMLIGAASYSLYLFHPVVLQFAVKATVFLHFSSEMALPAAAIALTAAIVFAVLMHLFVEKPILRFGRSVANGTTLRPGPMLRY